MKARSPKKHWRHDWVVSQPDLLHPAGDFGGELVRVLASFNAPKPTEFKVMLLELREQFRWPQSFAAASLNVSTSAITKWEAGTRQPTGAAAKLIWLYHTLLIKNNGPLNAYAVASWGKDTGVTFRDVALVDKMLLEKTYFFAHEEVEQMLGENSGTKVAGA